VKSTCYLRYNRTYVELKSKSQRFSNDVVRCYNRTYVELKFHSSEAAKATETGYNRTYVELKYVHSEMHLKNKVL